MRTPWSWTGPARGESYATYLANRVRRFVGPLSTFVGIIGLVATAVAWLGLPNQAVFMSSSLTKVLWFLFVYLFVVTVAPLMVTLQDRAGAVTLVVLLASAFAVDAWSFTYWPHDPVSAIDVRHLNIICVWLFCHQLGIAYHRGWWQHWPRWVALASVVVGVGGIWALVGPGPYPYPAVGFGDRIVSNLLPPTAAMALLCLAQTGLLAMVDRHDLPVLEGPRTQKVVKTLNLLLMTIYLWHVPRSRWAWASGCSPPSPSAGSRGGSRRRSSWPSGCRCSRSSPRGSPVSTCA
ncbi:hypothetical protein GCM10027418_29740 [Mariniluteicoccus endophyticus]